MQNTKDKTFKKTTFLSEIDLLVNAAFKEWLTQTNDLVFVKNSELVYVAASRRFTETAGLKSMDDIVGLTDWEIFEDQDLAKRYVTDDQKVLKSKENLINYIEPLVKIDGQLRYGSTSKYILFGKKGNPIGILGITKDITRDYLMKLHSDQVIQYLFKLPKNTYAVDYIDLDDWRIISQRRQSIDHETIETHDELDQFCLASINAIVDDEEAIKFYQNFSSKTLKELYVQGKNEVSFVYQRRFSDATIRWVRNSIRFLFNSESTHLCVLMLVQDIEVEKQKEKELVIAAHLDKMTMLYNRETTMESIRQILEIYADKEHALFIIDVDNFKTLNDTLGHQAGDEFLITLAKELKQCFRENSDIVGRVGGDEFFVLMKNITDRNVVKNRIKILLDAIHGVSKKYSFMKISGSVGVSIYPEHGRTLDTLYAAADKALYQAKNAGKDQVVFAAATEK